MGNNILCVACSLAEIFIAESSGETSLGEVNLCEKSLGGIVVNTLIPIGSLLGKKVHSGFQSVDDIIINTLTVHLLNIVVIAGIQHGVIVVNNGNRAEGTYHEEICECLPYKGLADVLVLGFL